MTHKILILNGPNLNMLGIREPEIYGGDSLDKIRVASEEHGDKYSLVIDFRQSNEEGELVNWIQSAAEGYSGVILNAGAYTHTSIAILDALKAIKLPTIEVHLSNIHQREPFRNTSYVSQIAVGVICGFGAQGYILAIDALDTILKKEAK